MPEPKTRIAIGDLFRCCIDYIEKHADEAEAAGESQLTCNLCTGVSTLVDGIWRWDSEASARTLKQ